MGPSGGEPFGSDHHQQIDETGAATRLVHRAVRLSADSKAQSPVQDLRQDLGWKMVKSKVGGAMTAELFCVRAQRHARVARMAAPKGRF